MHTLSLNVTTPLTRVQRQPAALPGAGTPGTVLRSDAEGAEAPAEPPAETPSHHRGWLQAALTASNTVFKSV